MALFRISAEIKVGPAKHSLFFSEYEYRNVTMKVPASDSYTAELRAKARLAANCRKFGKKIYEYDNIEVIEIEQKEYHPKNKSRRYQQKHNDSGRNGRVSF